MAYPEWREKFIDSISDVGYNINMKPITITDATIENLRSPQVEGWPAFMNDRLNREHQELLRLAQRQPSGVEVAVRYGDNFTNKVVSVGTVGRVAPDFSSGTIYMHNHPSGNTFTLKDVEKLLFNDNIELLSAVGHNGVIYTLHKAGRYSFSSVYAKYHKLSKNRPDYKASPEEYIRFMEDFLNSLSDAGLNYEKGR